MPDQELSILLESLLALLDTGNDDKAKDIIRSAIQRIDKSQMEKDKVN